MAIRFNMRSIWSCSSCVAWLFGTVILQVPGTSASQLRRKETVHRVEKVLVTTQLLGRRDESSCPVNHSLCPASLNGGCCPDRYGCGTDSCTATTAATTSACGKLAYHACGIEVGGGCCPEGFICGIGDCSPPPGVTQTQTCPGGYYLCPASYNFGCCQNGMGCGPNACYATTPVTNVFTETLTTTTDGNTVTTTRTATTVAVPSRPAGLPTFDGSGALPKFLPTTQPKISATVTPSQGSSGLTQAQLGGIIGGTIALLVIVLTATFIIVRKLHKTAKIVESRSSSTADHSSRPSNSKPAMRQYGPTPSQADHLEYDDLLQPSTQSASASAFSTPTPLPSATSAMDVLRNTSMDTSRGYFDVPARVQNMPGRHSMSTDVRTSVDSSSPHVHFQQHARHHSNTSELSDGSGQSGGVGSPLLPAELGIEGSIVPELPMSPISTTALEQARRRSNSGFSSIVPELPMSPLSTTALEQARRRSNSGVGVSPASPPMAHTRRRSDGRDRSGSFPVVPQPQTLDVVNENVEHLHGFYGRPDVAAGQTRALADLQQDISSPLAPQYQGRPFQG